ncbi:putative bifunctional diguanylate cyclase/phosphodiesterase [Altericista sp. CCNU0014]|uniref:putative bifunctional diguanylate cyclase/phosphodiesterase n=1 Tax=Altericista sp. CCNU0014 TaxID=3082949 RepID=UPI00384B515E
MVLLKIGFIISITLVILRFLLFVRLNRASCPQCGYALARVKRSAFDRFWGRLLFFPIGRFQCSYYRCDWEGISIHVGRVNPSESEPAELTHLKKQGLQNLKPLEKRTKFELPRSFKSEQNLLRALEQGEFLLYYQPRFELETNDIIGMEALLRWQHPEKGLIYPLEFISLAEQSDLIFSIGEWVFKTVCAQLQQWHRMGLHPLNISINLSPPQFYHPHLARMIQTILSDTELEPQVLEIEVSEATVMQYFSAASSVLRSLRALGVQTAMDRFGVSRIPRKQLQQLPLNILKIDRRFIRELGLDERAAEMVQSSISLARSLNLVVMAEGVETREQLHLLRSLDCQAAQGFLFDRPLSVDDATDVLQANWLGRRQETVSTSAGSLKG